MTRFDDESSGGLMVDEREVRAMFARRRPDPAAFSTGVADRLAAARAAVDGGDDDSTTPPAGDVRQATFAPRKMINRAAGWLGVPTLGSNKSLVVVVTWPLLLLLGVILSFGHSLRRVDPAHHSDRPKLSERDRKVHGGFVQLLPSLGSLLAIVAMATYAMLGGGAVADLLTLALMFGMVGMAWHIGQTARSGVACAAMISRSIVLLLLAAVFGCWAWLSSFGVFDGDSIYGHRTVGWILWSGAAFACVLAMWHLRSGDVGLALVLLFILPLLGVASLELPSNHVARVRECLATMSLEPTDLSNWAPAADMSRAMAAAGVAPVPLPHVRERLAAAIGAEADVHPQVWTTACQLGLLEQPQLAKLATLESISDRVDDLLGKDGPLRLRDYSDYLLECLLATRELTAVDREHLVQRLQQSWPQPGQRTDDLQQAVVCARWLDRLGRRDTVLARRDELHDLLQRHHATVANVATFSRPGGFCHYPERRYYSDIAATAHAVALISVVGVPPEVSLHHVHAFLRNSFRTSLLGQALARGSVGHARAEATLLHLQRGIGLPDRSWLAVLIGERNVLAALLLVLLGLRAIRVAHISERTLAGAMP